MVLTLEVIGGHASNLGANSRKVFNSIGGTIGRLPDNDWVFTDPYVSGRHALIRYVKGKYFIEDTSTNGVFINSPDHRLSRTQSYQLQDGDVLFIDTYQIRVAIEQDAQSGARNDVLAAVSRQVNQRPMQACTTRKAPKPEPRMSGAAQQIESDDNAEWFVVTEISEIAPVPAPSAGASRAQHSSPDLDGRASPIQAMLSAAGVTGLEPTRATAHAAGELLRTAVESVIQTLRAPEQMKEQLPNARTSNAGADLLLRSCANPSDAIRVLLEDDRRAGAPTTQTLQQASREFRDHQTAIVAAIRVAFQAMLARFDPDRLQEEFERLTRKGSLLGAPPKLEYWELYRNKYHELASNPETAFRSLFSEDFAKAYEDQRERLSALPGA
ncbi:MAG TPA: type VI secretion system-associated FHA domain protein [Steroidobacter sp.]|nr:type VI secretion system-associated FHA domain protein [Steroidobacter sp.]